MKKLFVVAFNRAVTKPEIDLLDVIAGAEGSPPIEHFGNLLWIQTLKPIESILRDAALALSSDLSLFACEVIGAPLCMRLAPEGVLLVNPPGCRDISPIHPASPPL